MKKDMHEIGCSNATTPWPDRPEDQVEAEEERLRRLVNLEHPRAPRRVIQRLPQW
jgi:hypothetical protein